jgi:hypothetical protein
MTFHSVHERGNPSGGTVVFRLSPVWMVLPIPIAMFCLLITPMFEASLWAAISESVIIEDGQQADLAIDVDVGKTYPAGTRLRIPGTDWSFVVPDHWQSNRPEDSAMPFLIAEEGKGLGMIFPLADSDRETVRDQLSQPLSLLHGLSFIPAGSELETENSISRSYQGDDMTGRALAVLGPGNACVLYFVMGRPDEAADFEAVLERLGQSTRFADLMPGQKTEL